MGIALLDLLPSEIPTHYHPLAEVRLNLLHVVSGFGRIRSRDLLESLDRLFLAFHRCAHKTSLTLGRSRVGILFAHVEVFIVSRAADLFG